MSSLQAFARVEAALNAAGLSSDYLDQFKQRKYNDEAVSAYVGHTSLNKHIENVISDKEELKKFIKAFKNVNIEVNVPFPPSLANMTTGEPDLDDAAGENAIDEERKESQAELPPEVSLPSILPDSTPLDDLDIGMGLPSERQWNTQKSFSLAFLPSLLVNSNETTLASTSNVQIEPLQFQIGSTVASQLLVEGSEDLESNSNSNSDVPKDLLPIPQITEEEYFNESLKQTGAPSPSPRPSPSQSPTPSSESVKNSDNEDDEIIQFLSRDSDSVETSSVVHHQVNSNQTPESASNSPLFDPKLSSSPQPLQEIQQLLQLTAVISVIQDSLTKYHENFKLLQSDKQTSFLPETELKSAHSTSQDWALEYYQQQIQEQSFPNQGAEFQPLLEQLINSSYKLSLAENSKLKNDSLRDAISKLEIYFEKTMKGKIQKLSEISDPNDPQFFILPETFLLVSEQCRIQSRNHFQRLLNLKTLDEFPLAQETCDKVTQTLADTMKYCNSMRKLEAEIKMKEDIQNLDLTFKSQMELKLHSSNYWTSNQLKELEGINRNFVITSFNSKYSKSVLYREGLQCLKDSIKSTFQDLEKWVVVQNAKFLISCAHLVYEQAFNYDRKLKEATRNFNLSKSQLQSASNLNEREKATEQGNRLKSKCLEILRNSPDFDKLPLEIAGDFVGDLTTRIDAIFKEVFPVPSSVSKANIEVDDSDDVQQSTSATSRRTVASKQSPNQPLNFYTARDFDTFKYTMHEFKPIGKGGNFYVEDSELRACINKEMLGSSVIDVYAAIVGELYPNARIAYLSSTAFFFTDNTWKVTPFLKDILTPLKQTASRAMTTIATIVKAEKAWMLLVANSLTSEIKIADTLKGSGNPKKLLDGIEVFTKHILNDIFGKKAWSTKYYTGIVEQNDGFSCGPAALLYLEKLFQNKDLKCKDEKEYLTQGRTIVERILQTTEEGNAILVKDNAYTKYIKGKNS